MPGSHILYLAALESKSEISVVKHQAWCGLSPAERSVRKVPGFWEAPSNSVLLLRLFRAYTVQLMHFSV